jgi:phosphomannomutase
MAGLASTDMLYFASGMLDLPGAMFTASDNPARYNGIKLCLAGATPISLDTGLARVRDDAQALLDGEVHQPVISRHSAHYNFSDFFRAAALPVLAALGGQKRPLSELVAGFSRYAGSGEINSVVADVPGKLDEIRTWAADRGAEIDELDGVTVSLTDGRWFSVRPSNTEPLLRLNVEGPTIEAMTSLRDETLALIRR